MRKACVAICMLLLPMCANAQQGGHPVFRLTPDLAQQCEAVLQMNNNQIAGNLAPKLYACTDYIMGVLDSFEVTGDGLQKAQGICYGKANIYDMARAVVRFYVPAQHDNWFAVGFVLAAVRQAYPCQR